MERKEEILEAAFKLFAMKGYNTSMSDIATQVGIKVPSLYNHFSSKDEIIHQVIKTETDHYYTELEEVLDSLKEEDYETRLRQFFYRVCGDFKEPEKVRFWKNISMICNDELRTQCGELVKEKELFIFRKISEDFYKASEEGILKNDNLEGAIYLYFTMIQGVLDNILIIQSTIIKQDGFSKSIWNAFWNGVKQ